MGPCTLDREWYLYIAVSLVSFLGGLVFLIPARICWYLFLADHNDSAHDRESPHRHTALRMLFRRIRAKAFNILSGTSHISKAVVITMWLLNMIAVILYLIDASTFSVEDCGPVRGDVRQTIWMTLCGMFIIHYVIRFSAATDKLFMWLDLYSIVDHFTIGPSFMALYLDRNWLGLKFLRLILLLKMPDILQLMSMLKSHNRIRLVQVATIFMVCWLASSGFVHISENNGDPNQDYNNAQGLTYWQCVYWLLVTMSTVGYGEISPSTDISRAFIVIFIMGSFAMFSTMIPEIVRSMGPSSKYRKPYKRTYGKTHIVLCGCITYDSVSNFLDNFLHSDSQSNDTDVVIVDTRKPSLELEAYFRRRHGDVTYVQGTCMDIGTLRSVKLRDADACLILADRKSERPDEEDAGNIMRATAVKNFHPSIRVIIQLLQHHNKIHLLHIPNWNWKNVNGDEVICIAELKMGIIAQSCLAPGFSTLMSNLFTMRSSKLPKKSSWTSNYRYGAGHEIYVHTFPTTFVGLNFNQAVQVCSRQLGILLVAVDVSERKDRSKLKLNPGPGVIIKSNTTGYFIAQSPEDVQRMDSLMGMNLSNTSHKNFNNLTSSVERFEKLSNGRTGEDEEESTFSNGNGGIGFRLAHHGGRSPGSDEEQSGQNHIYDFTGLFHWCPTRPFDQAILTYEESMDEDFRHHIVVCMLAEETSPVTGLINLITPLRASNLTQHNLKDVVIIGNLDHLKKEWRSLKNFPRVFVYEASHTLRSDLRAVSASRCSMCVVLSAGGPLSVDETLVDQHVVLATLNIRNMFGEQMEGRMKLLGIPSQGDMNQFSCGSSEIPLVTELEIDSNVAFLDQEDDDDPDTPLYLTLPYVSGSAFASSVLDSLMSATYLKGEVLMLIRALVTAGESEFEQVMTDGLGILRRGTMLDVTNSRERSRIGQLDLTRSPLDKLQHNMRYGDLVTEAISVHGILCLGIYRLIDPSVTDPRARRRYVMTNPPNHFKLILTDKIFVLRPYEMDQQSYTSLASTTSSRSNTSRTNNNTPSKVNNNASGSGFNALVDKLRSQTSATSDEPLMGESSSPSSPTYL